MTYSPMKNRLTALRDQLNQHGIQGFIIPHGDEFQNEFVPAPFERLKFLTGFTGSAGFAIVSPHKAVVMSDGRYTIQLKQQIDHSLFETDDSTKTTAAKWIIANFLNGDVVGFDPMLHSKQYVDMMMRELEPHGIKLKALSQNLMDNIWNDKPSLSNATIFPFPIDYAGLSHLEKIRIIADVISDKGCDAAFLSLPDSVSWTLNIRAHDVPHNPIVLSRLLIKKDATAILFIDESRINSDLQHYLGKDVAISSFSSFVDHVSNGIRKIWLDPLRTPVQFFNIAQDLGISIHEQKDPVIDMRAQKNIHEQKAMRAAHVRDGAAIVKFLHWLDQHKSDQNLSELSLAEALENCRRSSNMYRESSFDTICGWNGNGAIIHYRATPDSHAKIPAHANGILLLDSGGQYEDGTTDITRTISFGNVDPVIRTHNTLVLKGMIAISKARFPYGTTGAQIDVLARQALWDHGLDYPHGTGHGVGCFLSVHEEATSLSPRSQDKMEVGMIVSNEPGYYKENAYGIRIENLILCVDTGEIDELGRPILAFDTLTLAPIDRHLIDKELLDTDEIQWLNNYHARVLRELRPLLSDHEITWLQDACKAL